MNFVKYLHDYSNLCFLISTLPCLLQVHDPVAYAPLKLGSCAYLRDVENPSEYWHELEKITNVKVFTK